MLVASRFLPSLAKPRTGYTLKHFSMKINQLRFLVLLPFLLLPLSCSASNPGITCQFDPESGKPNPLGMRAYITITEKEGNTYVVFEQFPSNVADKITIANKREMILSETPLDTARVILLQNPDYYSELVGYEDPEGFAPVNEVLTCQ